MDSRKKALPPLIQLGQTHFSQKKKFLVSLPPTPSNETAKPERSTEEIQQNILHLTLQEKLFLQCRVDGEAELLKAYSAQYDQCVEQPSPTKSSELEWLCHDIEEIRGNAVEAQARLSVLNNNPELNQYEKSGSSLAKACQAARALLQQSDLPVWLRQDGTPHPYRSALLANSYFKSSKRKAVQLQPLSPVSVMAPPLRGLFQEARKSIAPSKPLPGMLPPSIKQKR